ncbi:hypothetical protein V5799_018432 [Amblyomma americanum]|uniref:Uncharacterized protein n=1 Tax=Amblyomma americanum TaxID=6943 RepID=A0AAQ4EZV0_AMBAM
MVQARLQHIVFGEWVPAVLGEALAARYGLLPKRDGYTRYDPSVDATLLNEFAGAALRFGHTIVNRRFYLLNANWSKAGFETLTGRFFAPFPTRKALWDQVARGLVRQPMTAFSRDVRDVDFFSAAISEYPLGNASMGPTIACIAVDSLGRLKWGDRFYYEHAGQAGSFTPAQLRTIRQTTLAKVICEDTEGTHWIQRNVFLLPREENPVAHCSDIPDIDVNAWVE